MPFSVSLGELATNNVPATIGQSCTFTVFGNLPLELRREIWKDARRAEGPRIVEITYDTTAREVVSLTPSPPLIVTSNESRAELLSTYPFLTTPNTGNPIYVDLSTDMLYIREDKFGIKSNNGTLLRTILGDVNPWINPILDLSAVRNLSIDFWIMNRAWLNLSSLQHLRSVQNFCVVMADVSSPRAFPTTTPASATRPMSLDNLVNVGFQRRDIEHAISRFWGVSSTEPGFSGQVDRAENLVVNYIPAELFSLQSRDIGWYMPPFDFVALARQ